MPLSDQAISLLELNSRIREQVRESFSDLIWVKAEINQLNTHYSGHCYLELIEKDGGSDTIKASIRGTIWASVYSRLSAFFITTTGMEIKAGMKVLVRVQVDFHEVYGISLNIRDIDPVYTLGDLARLRMEVIKKLEQAGVFDMNKELELSRVPQKIAVISSPTAAGYEDFCQQLNQNSGNYRFYHHLFPAKMQGEQTSFSIISALDRIAEHADFFEVVVLIRGGGSKTDLSYFDEYELAYYLTQFPLPVVTGIGHERDESVCDLVAHTSCKTPTAVAEFLISKAEEFEGELDWLKDRIILTAKKTLQEHQVELLQTIHALKLRSKEFHHLEDRRLSRLIQTSRSAGLQFISSFRHPIKSWQNRATGSGKTFLANRKLVQKHLFAQGDRVVRNSLAQKKHQLEIYLQKCQLLDPANVLKRGYSITEFNGKPLKNPARVKSGDQVLTHLHGGSIKSTVNTINYDIKKSRNS